MGKTIGIDLGTTNSVVAFATKDVEILELEGHSKLMPSCVSYTNKIFKVGKDPKDNLLYYSVNRQHKVDQI